MMIIIVIAQFLWQDNQLRITAIFSIIKEINSKRIAALCGRAGLLLKNFQVFFSYATDSSDKKLGTVRLATGWVLKLVGLNMIGRVLDLTDALKQSGFCKSYVKKALWNRQSDVKADLRSACFGEGLSLKKPAGFPPWTQNACPL